jgi:isoleucyl-tRNA synthetase
LTDFPADYDDWKDESLASTWERLLDVRSDVQKSLEEVRVPRKQKKPGQIGSSQEAHVTVTAEGATYELLKSYEDSLAMLFITSSAEVAEGSTDSESGVGIAVRVADGEKCPRCWNFWIEPESGDEVCGRCADVLGD